ncbi:MAG: hypothetical protein ACRD0V_21260 [Acidimicrobiales bacterium]
MGQPVVHFEVTGKDYAALQSFYSQLGMFNDPERHLIGVVKAGTMG